MPTGAVLLARLRVELAEEFLQKLRGQLSEDLELDSEDFYSDGPLILVRNVNEGPIPIDDGVSSWVNVNLWKSYYRPGYERGDLELFVRCAEWLEQHLENCEVWYGHDVDDENLRVFDKCAREILLDYQRSKKLSGRETDKTRNS